MSNNSMDPMERYEGTSKIKYMELKLPNSPTNAQNQKRSPHLTLGF